MKDKRKSFYLMVDTETANGLSNPLVYDLGLAVVDKRGNVYHADSLMIFDIYRGERELMQSAYYAEKIPMYERQYEAGLRRMVRFSTAWKLVQSICDEWSIKAIIAHNARFDYNALNTTQRFLTGSAGRYFLPYGIPLWCTLTMAKDVIAPQKSYIRFCENKPEERLYKGKPRLTAELLYQYIIGDEGFKEEHTGLADVLIEKEIFVRCMRQKKKMKRSPWKEEKEPIENTELQRRINNLAHYQK